MKGTEHFKQTIKPWILFHVFINNDFRCGDWP